MRRRRIPKRYGQSQVPKCPFCSEIATTKNNQKVPVCRKHVEKEVMPLKCVCSKTLLLMHGKFGVFWNCIDCGNFNFKKALEMNAGNYRRQ